MLSTGRRWLLQCLLHDWELIVNLSGRKWFHARMVAPQQQGKSDWTPSDGTVPCPLLLVPTAGPGSDLGGECQEALPDHCRLMPQLGEWWETQILKFNLPPPPPTHLVCNARLIENFLCFHMSLVIVMNCGAGNSIRGFEISMIYFFLKLYSVHISKDILLLQAQNAIKQCKWYFSRKSECQGLRKCKIGKSATMHGRTAAPYIMHDF